MDYAFYSVHTRSVLDYPDGPGVGQTGFGRGFRDAPIDDAILAVTISPSDCNTALTFWLGADALEPRDKRKVKDGVVFYDYSALGTHVGEAHFWPLERVEASGFLHHPVMRGEQHRSLTFWLGSDVITD